MSDRIRGSIGAVAAIVVAMVFLAPAASIAGPFSVEARRGAAPASFLHLAQATKSTTYRLGDLIIEAPWSRATPGGAKVAGGYMRITNAGTRPDRLIAGEASFAGRVEIHEMSMTGGVMRMRELKGGLEIAPGATVELKPGGFHVMFMDLREPLREGQKRRGKLVFERAGTIEVEFTVAPMGGMHH